MNTLGEVRDLLAGLCAPELERLGHLPDHQPAEVSVSSANVAGGAYLAVAVELPGARLRGAARRKGGRA